MPSLEIFVLAMIAKAGTRTLYDFKAAGVSTGAVRGPITSLLKKGYLLKSKGSGERQSQALAITRSGVQALEDRWRDCLEESPSDMGAALRSFWVACLMGDPKEASIYLQRVVWHRGNQRKGRGWEKVLDDEDTGHGIQDASAGYSWLRDYWTILVSASERSFAEDISSKLSSERVIAGIARGDRTTKREERTAQTSKSKKEER